MLTQEEKFELESIIENLEFRIAEEKRQRDRTRFLRLHAKSVQHQHAMEDLIDVLRAYKRRLYETT